MRLYVDGVIVKLFIVAESPAFREPLNVLRQQFHKSRMWFTDYTLMKQTKNTNIPSETRRSEIEFKKGMLVRNA